MAVFFVVCWWVYCSLSAGAALKPEKDGETPKNLRTARKILCEPQKSTQRPKTFLKAPKLL